MDNESQQRLCGTVESVIYRNESNDYTVLELSLDGAELVTAVGIIPGVCEGEQLTLAGNWSYHKEFGRQFAFTTYEKSLPKEIDGIIQYLSSRTIKGVGPVTALKIVNRFGTDTFDVIENHPEWLVDIPGITMKKAGAISESFREQSEHRAVMMFFKDYMDPGEINRVYKHLGYTAVDTVRENPYILCGGFYGISFEKVDEIAYKFGYKKDGEERMLAGLNYLLEYNSAMNGHTCIPRGKIVESAATLLSVEVAKMEKLVEHFISQGEISEYRVNDISYVMSRETDEAESFIVKSLLNMVGGIAHIGAGDIGALIESVEAGNGVIYAPLQRQAIYKSIDNGVSIITGGPGTGKTTIVKALISIFNKLGFSTALAAPTGRAAKRMSEATSEEAKTIHRLLEMEKTETGVIRFNRNAKFPIEESIVIVDEASMVDLLLLEALLKAMRRGSRLILIGDADQLPSVGAGNVLDDLIGSGVIPTVCLKEVFRQSGESLIVTNAHRINDGQHPILGSTDKDFFFVRRDDETMIAKAVADLISDRLPRAYGKSIKDDIQIITPSKRGLGGVEVLNKEIQARINPPAQFKKEITAHSSVFRVGDRVMQITNDYEIEWERNQSYGIGIYNGDIGVIEDIFADDRYMNIRFDDRLVHYEFDKLDELELAYAITVHKSQGSEYPVVIIPMYKCSPLLMSRNLFYTAVTRARRMVVLVGRPEIPGIMVENNREIQRYTTLRHRLIGCSKD